VLLRREGWSVNLQMIVDEVIEAGRIEYRLRTARGSDLETGRIDQQKKTRARPCDRALWTDQPEQTMTTLCLAG